MARFVGKGDKGLSRVIIGLAHNPKRWKSGVLSFGDGSNGALGLPTAVSVMGSDSYEPTPVPGLPSDISAVAAGHYHSLAVTSQAQLWAWGRNNEAQLGRGVNSPRFLFFYWFFYILQLCCVLILWLYMGFSFGLWVEFVFVNALYVSTISYWNLIKMIYIYEDISLKE